MDSLTQIVLGAAVGEACLGKKVGNKALLWGGIAGTIPDLDVLFTFGDPIREIVVHRGFSHSILFAVLIAPLLGWLVMKLYAGRGRPEANFQQWSWFFFWSVFTHPLLDCLTTYGTQLFYPFSDHRVSISSVFVVDPLYTLPFLILTLAGAFYHRESFMRRNMNRFGILLSSLYLLVGYVNKQLAESHFEADLQQNAVPYERGYIGPTPMNILLWYGVYETKQDFRIGYWSVLDEEGPIQWDSYGKQHDLLAPYTAAYGVDRLMWFSKGFHVIRQDGDALRFYTLNYGRTQNTDTSAAGSFSFYYKIMPQPDGTVNYDVIRETEELDVNAELTRLWHRALGRKDGKPEPDLLGYRHVERTGSINK